MVTEGSLLFGFGDATEERSGGVADCPAMVHPVAVSGTK